MSPLSSREVKVFSEALEKIHMEMDVGQFPARILQIIQELLPDVVVTMDEFDTRTGVTKDTISHPPVDYASWRARFNEVIPIEHPIYHAIQAGHRELMSVSDFLSNRQLRSTCLFSEVFNPIGVSFQVVLPLTIPHHVAGITINRATDFAETERTLAGLLAPHVAQAHMHAQRFTLMRGLQEQRLPEVEELRTLGMTRREAEILQWVIQGKRDGEIAAIVGASVRTAQKHVQSILSKLGVETRTAAAVEAVLRCNRQPPGVADEG